jgi:hypothetical protein
VYDRLDNKEIGVEDKGRLDKIRMPNITSGFDCKMKSTFGIVLSTMIKLVTSSYYLLPQHHARFLIRRLNSFQSLAIVE